MSISAVGGYGSYQTQQSYSVRGGGGGDFATRFAAMDANGDGSLDVSESGLSADTFTKTDSDGDGLLTYSDFTSQMQSMAGQGRGPGGPGGAPPPAEEMISQLDSDGDGELSAEEFAIDSEMFSAIDSDGSGGLSQAELEAHRGSMEAQRQAAQNRNSQSYQHQYGLSAYQAQSGVSPWMLASQGASGGISLTA